MTVRRDLFKYISLAFMAVCMLVAAVLTLSNPLPGSDNPTWMFISMGVIGLPVSVALLAYEIRKLLFDRNMLVIDESGILDRSNVMAPGKLEWEQIEGVYKLSIRDDTFLCIDVRERDAWMAGLSRRARRLAQANVDMGYAPVRIQAATFSHSVTTDDLLRCVRELHPELVRKGRKVRVGRHK